MNPFFPGGIQKVNIFPSGSKALPVLLFFSITGGRYISLLSETSEQHDEDTPACNSVGRLTCTKLMKEKQLAPLFQSQTRPLLSKLLFTIGNHKSRLPLWTFQSELDDKKKKRFGPNQRQREESVSNKSSGRKKQFVFQGGWLDEEKLSELSKWH